MVIFPEPKRMSLRDERVSLRGGVTLVLSSSPDELELRAAEVLRKRFQASGIAEGKGLRIILGTPDGNSETNAGLLKSTIDAPNSDQAYAIKIVREGITLAGNQPLGVLYAAQTLVQMLESEGDSLPTGEIVDWPEMQYRGIFAESRWCSELMTLQDWKDAIEQLASLKFNIFNIGIANNWMIQYEGKRSEFLLVPIKKYPELRTPKSVEYYSPEKGKNVRLEYLPLMFTEDFFGEVVAYGKKWGITVRPHFNTPGHNSLIPHVIPEVGAVDEDGKPTGYGFCFSNPKTYEVVFDIFDEIIDRYLLPNGVHSFHVGLDEVYPLASIDEDEPTRVISPYCRCPKCREHEWHDQFVDYVLALAKHLVEKGITQIGMWHDSFLRGGKMNEELAERFRKEGLLDKVVLHWWRYNGFFDDIHPELDIKRWVVPMTGYYFWSPYLDHLDNIHRACKVGHAQGAEGTESYSIYNRAYYRHYACLSEFSWGECGDLEQFRDKFTRYLFGENELEGRKAFKSLDLISGPLSSQMYSIWHYSYAYAHAKESAFIKANYPQAILEKIWDNPGNLWSVYHILRGEAKAAQERFAKSELWKRDPADLGHIYPAECARIAASANLFLTLAETIHAYRNLQDSEEFDPEVLSGLVSKLEGAQGELDLAMARIESDLDAYLVPSMLRELTIQRDFLLRFSAELRRVAELAAQGDLSALPELDSLKCHPINWIG